MFLSSLRSVLNQGLVDSLSHQHPSLGMVGLRLSLSREVSGGRYVSVAASQSKSVSVTRDMKKVPPPPERLVLRTGDRVRVEVSANLAGYVTVFNIGPSGELLWPAPMAVERGSPPNLPAGRSVEVLDIEMQPPVGRERLFALWTRSPVTWNSDRLRAMAGGSTIGSLPSNPRHGSR